MQNEEGEWIDKEGWPEERTVEEMRQNLADNIKISQERRQTTKANSSRYNSIHKAPLLPITAVDHIVPPVLHMQLGLVQRFFNLLESKCRSIDKGSTEVGVDREDELYEK